MYNQPSSTIPFKLYLLMISCGMILIGSLMYSGRFIGVPRQKLDTSSVKNLAPGVDSTELHSILIVSKFDVGYSHYIYTKFCLLLQ